MEEELGALTGSSTNEDICLDLASIIKTKPDRATRDCFYNDLFSLSEIEALRKVIDLLQVTLEDTNLVIESFETWNYLTTRKLWEGLDDVFDNDESVNGEIRPLRHSSVFLCLLVNFRDVLSVEDANAMLKKLTQIRKDIWENAAGQGVESLDNSETYSTDSETTDLEYFKDDIDRSFTCGEHGSSKPFALIWDLLDILTFAELDSVLGGILGGIAEAIFFDAASFLQACLFFGMIAEVFGSFGVAVESDDFIRYDGEDPIISFLFLPSYLEAWISDLDSKDYQSVLEGSQKAMEILSAVDEFTSQLLHLDIPDALGPIVQLSAILEDIYSTLISDITSGS
ncbi:hypothetical protein BDV33DRAFT_198567 [Aspergillus novoparasiticus]|uniref:Uncharacterized protein n=1 Tax=Aspergillus novoparasiticus TaxID=986946 RepID=A0A5N6F9A8_9EURO|nr:hypothetical protein BDV33DRAFT_198567 [Aspergillus novoparasiticus]